MERREDRIAYELHILLGQKLQQDEERIRNIGRNNLERMRRTRRNRVAQRWIEQWESLLNGTMDELVIRMLADDELGRELRHMSPFAGALTDDERSLAIRRARELAPQ